VFLFFEYSLFTDLTKNTIQWILPIVYLKCKIVTMVLSVTRIQCFFEYRAGRIKVVPDF